VGGVWFCIAVRFYGYQGGTPTEGILLGPSPRAWFRSHCDLGRRGAEKGSSAKAQTDSNGDSQSLTGPGCQ